jgi:hypothetical protein
MRDHNAPRHPGAALDVLDLLVVWGHVGCARPLNRGPSAHDRTGQRLTGTLTTEGAVTSGVRPYSAAQPSCRSASLAPE